LLNASGATQHRPHAKLMLNANGLEHGARTTATASQILRLALPTFNANSQQRHAAESANTNTQETEWVATLMRTANGTLMFHNARHAAHCSSPSFHATPTRCANGATAFAENVARTSTTTPSTALLIRPARGTPFLVSAATNAAVTQLSLAQLQPTKSTCAMLMTSARTTELLAPLFANTQDKALAKATGNACGTPTKPCAAKLARNLFLSPTARSAACACSTLVLARAR